MSATITPPRTGRYPLPVVLEAAGGERHHLAGLTIEVHPVDHCTILDENVASGWAVEVSGGAQAPVFDASAEATRGSTVATIAVAAASFVGWQLTLTAPEPIRAFGYEALAFSIHPGDVTGRSLLLGTGSTKSITLVGRKAGRFIVDLTHDAWQEVVIPLEDLLDPGADFDQLRFSGSLEGTFHLDDVRLVAAEAPVAATAVMEHREHATPESFALWPNYPNPFNSGTVIPFALERASEVQLEVYDVLGQRVAKLVRGRREAGRYTVRWDGRNDAGGALASGVYFVRLQAGDHVDSHRLVLVR